jgi:2-polyprenyl-3-methyl-5-hydroxy-6-metoxy-1,4-benzoquinol methylase
VPFFKKLKLYLLRSGKPGWLIYKFLWLSKVAVKVVTNGRFRSETYYGIKPNRNHHQIYTFTALDRYPDLFTECRRYFLNFQNNPEPKILSFGCSTGEEVYTLGTYMPFAIIVGIDINQWCINQCRKKNIHSKHFFYNRNSTDFENSKDFDAIFCMAVLQRTENRTSANNSVAIGYTFSKFESEVLGFTKSLQ